MVNFAGKCGKTTGKSGMDTERKGLEPRSPGSPLLSRPTPQKREAQGRSCTGGSGAAGQGKRAGCAQTRGAQAGRTGPTVRRRRKLARGGRDMF